MPCSGNKSQICGGRNANSIYQVECLKKTLGLFRGEHFFYFSQKLITIFVILLAKCLRTPIGCYADAINGGGVDLNGGIAILGSSSMTVEVCISFCLSKGFIYAGVQNG